MSGDEFETAVRTFEMAQTPCDSDRTVAVTDDIIIIIILICNITNVLISFQETSKDSI
jgi:hypothetical protein